MHLQNVLTYPQIIFSLRKSIHTNSINSCLIQVVERLPCGSINVLGIAQVLHNYLSYFKQEKQYQGKFLSIFLHTYPVFLCYTSSTNVVRDKLTYFSSLIPCIFIHSKIKHTYKSSIFPYLICNSKLKRIHQRIKFTYKFVFSYNLCVKLKQNISSRER